MPELIDTHAHLYGKRFSQDLTDVLDRAEAAGVVTTIVPATKPSEFDEIERVSQAEPDRIRIALGVHPHSAADVDDAEIDRLSERVLRSGAVAVGEIGLDYYYDFAPKERQIAVFRRQLAIARDLDLPAVIHNRESDEDVLESIAAESGSGALRFQLHCFSSSVDVLKRALDLGGHVSFTGNITFRKSDLEDVVATVPEDRYMLETDAPYMTPVPNRGKRNEPLHVVDIAAKIAEIRNESPERIAEMTTTTARRFFGIATLLLAVLLAGFSSVSAQTVEPATEVDTTERTEPYDKLVGIGGHLTSTTFLVDKETSASDAAFGFRLSTNPLLPIGIDWFGLDVTYTPMRVPGSIADTGFRNYLLNLGRELPPIENVHQTLDIYARFNFKPKAFVDIYGTIGFTHFYNAYGEDELIINELGDEATVDEFEETISGIGGGLGLALNVETDFGVFEPRAEIIFSSQVGDRTIDRRGDVFQLSQARLSVVYFPPLADWLGLDYGD